MKLRTLVPLAAAGLILPVLADPQPPEGPISSEVPDPVPGDPTSPYGGLTEWARDHDSRMAWFREARFGMFIHWGLYAAAGGYWPPNPASGKRYEQNYAEWIEAWAKVPTADYAAQARPLFEPDEGCAGQWAALAEAAGMRYAVLTAKHHEGFTLFNSQQPYSLHNEISGSTNISPEGRDLFGEFAEAMRARDIRPAFYYSIIDWQHPLSPTRRPWGIDNPGEADIPAYAEYFHGHLHELLTNYGKMAVLWSDYTQEGLGDDPWHIAELLTQVREDQPSILINNRFWPGSENPNGDFFTPEKWVPAEGVPGRDFEVNHTMNESYGFSHHDEKWKSTEEVVKLLVDIVSKGGNLLLNVGPDRHGRIPAACVESLTGVGAWMKVNSEAIYGTTGNPEPATELPFDGRVTAKVRPDGSRSLYLHLFALPEDRKVILPFADGPLDLRVTLLGREGQLEVEQSDVSPATVTLPADLPADSLVPVLRVDFPVPAPDA